MSTLLFEIDTRIPGARLRWTGIGQCFLWYEQGWRVYIRVFFFQKTIRIADIPRKTKKPGKRHRHPLTQAQLQKNVQKGIQLLRSGSIQQWKLALDTGDYTRNALLYPLNFYPPFQQHLLINFSNDNYLFIRIRHKIWSVLYAFFRY